MAAIGFHDPLLEALLGTLAKSLALPFVLEGLSMAFVVTNGPKPSVLEAV